MTTDLSDLLRLLDLETIEPDLYRGQVSIGTLERVYGGQVAAQALVAAGRTVDDGRFVHSLHAYFMRPGDASHPIVYDVERLRDGGSFTTRRVRARQHGEAIFTLEASFHVIEDDGLVHQPRRPRHPTPRTCRRSSTSPRDAAGRRTASAGARSTRSTSGSTRRPWRTTGATPCSGSACSATCPPTRCSTPR